MEEDIQYHKTSTIGKTGERIDTRLHRAIDKATERGEYEIAHDEQLLKALSVVEDFIKRKKRVCYGGTAMNALLPANKKFYNPDRDLPDYDFYTPDAHEDVDELVKELKSKGFKEVHHKLGIHEGTKKVLVNYIAVADVSSIDKELFNVLLRRSILKEGVRYTDPDILRMMMYLELSRPKGDVDRWPKVFERLQLINKYFPIRGCTASLPLPVPIPFETRKKVLDYIIEWKRILCNGPTIQLYKQGIYRRKAIFRMQEGGAPVFTSPDPKIDALALKKELGENITMHRHHPRGEIVPERIEVQKEGKTVCVIIQEIACHSYNSFPTTDGRTIHIGSLEFLITLYLSLSIFTTNAEDLLGKSILCQVAAFIKLLNVNYRAKKSQFAPFALDCRGHQTRYESLLREKVKRTRKERDKELGLLRKTLKRSVKK
jgi:hypothetical protein